MTLIVLTGTCGAGKSTVLKELARRLDPERFVCLDADGLGLNWWDYAGTEREHEFHDDCMAEAVRRGAGRHVVLGICMNPQDYFEKHIAPPAVEATYFAALCPTDGEIRRRLQARPAERGFTSEERIAPHVAYNGWFRKNRGKFSLFLDTGELSEEEAARRVEAAVLRWTREEPTP